MIIVRIVGGFASQLQKYNFGWELSRAKNTELCLDLSEYMNGYFRPFVLHAFNLPDCRLLTDAKLLKGAKRITTGEQLLEAFENWHDDDIYISGEESYFSAFLDQYPQFKLTEKSEIYRFLTLKADSKAVTEFKLRIENGYSIGVHIRLGDFVTVGANNPLEYYKAALGRLLKGHSNAKVFFFSNDITSVKNEFGNRPEFNYVSIKNGYLGDLEEFLCLSLCKMKILSARSSYGRYATQMGIKCYGYDRAITCEEIYGMENSAVLLNESDYAEGLHYFERSYSSSGAFRKEQKDVFSKPDMRYDTVAWTPEIYSEGERTKFWKEYYNDVGIHPLKVVIITDERYNRWYYKECVKRAIIESRKGNDVLYINIACRDSFGLDQDEIIHAQDMDGRELGFSMYLSHGMVNLEKVVGNIWHGYEYKVYTDSAKNRILDCIVGVYNRIFRKYMISNSKLLGRLPQRFSQLGRISMVSELFFNYKVR